MYLCSSPILTTVYLTYFKLVGCISGYPNAVLCYLDDWLCHFWGGCPSVAKATLSKAQCKVALLCNLTMILQVQITSILILMLTCMRKVSLHQRQCNTGIVQPLSSVSSFCVVLLFCAVSLVVNRVEAPIHVENIFKHCKHLPPFCVCESFCLKL